MPTLTFDDCKIYDESCNGMWMSADGTSANFMWQFREKGDMFELSNQSKEGTVATAESIKYTGIYTVDESNKDELRLSSSQTFGNTGKMVMITMEKQ